MSDRKAPRSARSANPYADTSDGGGARRGLFSRVLWQTSRLWRRPLARRLAISRRKGAAARWQMVTADGVARCAAHPSLRPGHPKSPNPKKLYHTPVPIVRDTPMIPRSSRFRFPITRITRPPKNTRGDFRLPIFERRSDV